MRALIVEIVEAGCGAADETAALRAQGVGHPPEDRGIEQHIVVQVMDVGGMALFEQELPLLGHPSARQVPVYLHPVPMPAQRPDEGVDLAAFQIGRPILGLIEDGDIEIGEGLPEQTRQHHRQPCFPSTRRDQHIHCRHRSVCPAFYR